MKHPVTKERIERFVAFVTHAGTVLDSLGYDNQIPYRSTIDGWIEDGICPQAESAKKVVLEIWQRASKAGQEATLDKLTTYLRSEFPDSLVQTDAADVADYFCRYIITARKIAKKSSASKPLEAKTVKKAFPLPTRIELTDPVKLFVDRLFTQAGFKVSNGMVAADAETQIRLEPLYRYILRLQQSATIPNYFPGVPEIPLDGFFVELSATDDLRADVVLSRGAAFGSAQSADPIDVSPISSWRSAANQKRIPLETVVSATELRPVVVFGDPGSGKSTLLLYALHELGRGAASGRGLHVPNVIPFRISLREFARDAKDLEFQVIRYLVRKELGVVDATEFENWRYLLSYFFSNERPFRLFLLVDGLDEVTPDPDVFKQVRERLVEASSIARVIFTSRRAGFLQPVNQFTSYELVELSEPAMHQLISNWFSKVHRQEPDFVQSFRNWVFSDPRRHEMATNPCLLSLLCFLNQSCGPNEFIEARSRAALYAAAMRKLVGDSSRSLPPSLSKSLATLSAFALDRYVSLGTAAVPIALFSREELRQFILKPRLDSECRDLDLSDDQLDSIWLRTRLVSQWNLGEWYHFLHLTFQEFFAARWLVTRPIDEVTRWVELYQFNPYWREVWRFYAGLCAAAGPSGRSRFEALLRAFASAKDRFGQSLFHLSPLVAEYGWVDTQEILGFDLRTRLHELVLSGHNQTRYFIRLMVDTDPRHFLGYVQGILTPILDFYSAQVDAPRPDVDAGEIRLAVDILESLYHPEAVRFQRALIQAELEFPTLQDSDPALGPTIPSGRNELLGQFLENWLPSAKSPLQRHRAVSYLSCARTPDAGTAILNLAQSIRTNRRPRATKRQRRENLEILVHCLWALCELRDTKAVVLAGELWNDPEFRSESLGEAATFLAEIRSLEVPSLVESWFAQEGAPMTAADLEPLLELLKPWAERTIPPSLENLLTRTDVGPSVRASVWEIICRRGGIQGQTRLRRHLQGFANKTPTDEDFAELVAISEFVAHHHLPFLGEAKLLLEKFASHKSQLGQDAIWTMATSIVASNAVLLADQQWLQEVPVPALHNALLKPGQMTEQLSQRLAAFQRAPANVWEAIAKMTSAVWSSVASDKKRSLLRFFTEFPARAPIRVVHEALESDDAEIRITAMEILATTDPGRLLERQDQDPKVNDILLAKSTRDGTLYFQDGFFDPTKRAYRPYFPVK